MSLTPEDLTLLQGMLTQLGDRMDSRISKLDDKVSAIDGRLQKVERTVNAIETLPQPYGRPKSFVSATEFHSVSNPVRSKQGYQG